MLSMGPEILTSIITIVSVGAMANAVFDLLKSFVSKKKIFISRKKDNGTVRLEIKRKDGSFAELELNPKDEVSIRQFLKKATNEVGNDN